MEFSTSDMGAKPLKTNNFSLHQGLSQQVGVRPLKPHRNSNISWIVDLLIVLLLCLKVVLLCCRMQSFWMRFNRKMLLVLFNMFNFDALKFFLCFVVNWFVQALCHVSMLELTKGSAPVGRTSWWNYGPKEEFNYRKTYFGQTYLLVKNLYLLTVL